MKKTALFVGRFQPLHFGHMGVIEDALRRFDHLKIVLGSANESRTQKNPWTPEQRASMLREAGVKRGWDFSKMTIYTLDDAESDEQWFDSLRETVGDFDVFLTGNPWNQDICQQYGIAYENLQDANIHATDIREKLQKGEDVSDVTYVTGLPEKIMNELR